RDALAWTGPLKHAGEAFQHPLVIGRKAALGHGRLPTLVQEEAAQNAVPAHLTAHSAPVPMLLLPLLLSARAVASLALSPPINAVSASASAVAAWPRACTAFFQTRASVSRSASTQ